jgi:hypothetical protein
MDVDRQYQGVIVGKRPTKLVAHVELLIWLGIQIVTPSIVLGQEGVADKAIGEGCLFPCCRVAALTDPSKLIPGGFLKMERQKLQSMVK